MECSETNLCQSMLLLWDGSGANYWKSVWQPNSSIQLVDKIFFRYVWNITHKSTSDIIESKITRFILWIKCTGKKKLFTTWVNISFYNPLINFRTILWAILGHVVSNRRAGIRQYTPSVSLFALPFFSGKKAWHKVNKVSRFSVFIFFNNLKWKQ